MSRTIRVPAPELQIAFADTLRQLRSHYLQDALISTVEGLDIPTIDGELAKLNSLARFCNTSEHSYAALVLW